MKTLVQLAAFGLGVGLCVTPGVAQAFSLSIAGTPVTFSSCINGVTTGNNIQCSFSRNGVVDANNNRADVRGTLLVAAGSLTVTGGSLSGIVVNLTNFLVTASASNPVGSLFGNFGTTPFIEYSHTFNGVTFDPLVDDSVTAQQILSGQYLSNSTTTNVNSNSKVTAQVNITGVASLNSLTTGTVAASNTSDFGLPSLRTTLIQSILEGQADNPTITGRLTGLKLAPGQSLSLPSSSCFAMAHTGNNQLFTPKAAEDNCTSLYKIPPQDPVSTPEPSSLLGAMVMGLVGLGSSLKRWLLG